MKPLKTTNCCNESCSDFLSENNHRLIKYKFKIHHLKDPVFGFKEMLVSEAKRPPMDSDGFERSDVLVDLKED